MNIRQRAALLGPDVLTLSRLPLAVLVWALRRRPLVMLAVMVVAGLTDAVDGRVARRLRARRVARGLPVGDLGQPGAHGAWLDPVCDKAFVLASLAAVVEVRRPPAWVVVLVSLREWSMALVLLGSLPWLPRPLPAMRFDWRANPWGKAATVAQGAALTALALGRGGLHGLAAVAGVVGAAATTRYSQRGWRRWREVLAETAAAEAEVPDPVRPVMPATASAPTPTPAS